MTIQPTTAVRLVRLRGLLHEAQVRAADRSDAGVHAAVVGLDGVCELTMGLAAYERDVEIPDRGGLPELARRLAQKLGPAWDRAGLKAFRELHRARNSAQHEGVLPRGSQIPIWSAEAERFIYSLIAAAFGVDLADVSAASAIEHAELRDLLLEAELNIDAEEYESSISKSHQAVVDALRNFQQRRGGSRPASFPDPLGLNDTPAIRDLHRAVEDVERFLDVATLASDPGEWRWLHTTSELLGHTEKPFDRGDAQRAFVFALNWVLRYEVFVARYGDRRYVHGKAPDPYQTYEKPRLLRVRPQSGPKTIMLYVETSPPPPSWNAGLHSAIQSVRSEGQIPDGLQAFTGSGGLIVDLPEDADPGVAFVLIQRLIDQTHRLYEQGLATMRERDQAARDAVGLYQAELEKFEHQGLVASVSVPDGQQVFPGFVQIEVSLPGGVSPFALAPRLTAALNARVDAADAALFVPATAEPKVTLVALADAVAELELAFADQLAERAAIEEREQRLAGGVHALIDAGPDVSNP